MPYCTQDRKDAIDSGEPPANVGELTYLLTKCVVDYVAARPASYQAFAEAQIAALNTAFEFYRREVGPYEDLKAAENGDVFARLHEVKWPVGHGDPPPDTFLPQVDQDGEVYA